MQQSVEALRDKIATKREGLIKFIENGNHPTKAYEQGLRSQEATFDYVIGELNKILDTAPEN